ncbi:MAG TPA: hypothetical protein VEJ16_08525 [Alphaproteobacteria bacterium]|nr:hypothetical protein [Alphaproteobacteria bacterium]
MAVSDLYLAPSSRKVYDHAEPDPLHFNDGIGVKDHFRVREFYLKLKLKGSPGYRHVGRVVRLGALTKGCEIDVSYLGHERRAVVRDVTTPRPSRPELTNLPVVEADEL